MGNLGFCSRKIPETAIYVIDQLWSAFVASKTDSPWKWSWSLLAGFNKRTWQTTATGLWLSSTTTRFFMSCKRFFSSKWASSEKFRIFPAWLQTALHSVSVHTLKELICTLQREVISHSHLKVDFPGTARTVWCKQRWNPRVWQDEGLNIASNSAHIGRERPQNKQSIADGDQFLANVRICNEWLEAPGKDDKYPDLTTDKCQGRGLSSVISSPLCSSSWHHCGGSDDNQSQPTTKTKKRNDYINYEARRYQPNKYQQIPSTQSEASTPSKQLKATQCTNPARQARESGAS